MSVYPFGWVGIQLVLVLAGTLALLVVSRPCLKDPRCHGFYRFFAWTAILIEAVLNLPAWFKDALAWHQLISWFLLCTSVIPALWAGILFRKEGGSRSREEGSGNYAFENTGRLITSGIYKYIRHPMYASLLYLLWGIFFKVPNVLNGIISLVGSIFLLVTAAVEERENLHTFGDPYRKYMKLSRRFIPWVF